MLQQLPVPYHPQKANGYCLAACAQMTLHYWGIVVDQERLAKQLGVEPDVGVPAGRIKRLVSHDMTVIYDSGEWELLQVCLARNAPVIAMIQAGELSQWQGNYFQYAVVIIGHDDSQVWMLDSALQPEPVVVSIDEFMLAWEEMDYRYAVLERQE